MQLIPDLAESFVSPVDGSVISSRSDISGSTTSATALPTWATTRLSSIPNVQSRPRESAAPVLARLMRGERA